MNYPFLSDFIKRTAKWEWMHESWMKLIPKKDFNEFKETDETEKEYISRIAQVFPLIPDLVLAQLFFEHAFNEEFIRNYGWIDFGNASFTRQKWPIDALKKVRVFSNFQSYVNAKSLLDDYGSFSCNSKDLRFWKEHGTWRVPIVVLDCGSLNSIPKHAEIKGRYQLIEGHTRLGYARALMKMALVGSGIIAESHEIFLLQLH